MKRPGMEKLLGGYAAGNLTEAERRALFEAALEDQHLFDALANEEALRELLADPACRRRIAEATAGPRFNRWRMLVPAAVLATTAVLAFFMLRVAAPQPEPPRVEMAKNIQPAAVPAPAPPPNAPAPARALRQFAPPPEAKRKAAPPIAPPPELAVSPAPVRLSASPPPPPSPQKSRTSVAVAGRPPDALPSVTRMAAKGLAEMDTMRFAVTPSLRYTLEQRLPGGDFVTVDAALPLDAQAALRIKIQPPTAGYLYVTGSRGLLFSTKAEAMKEYTVDLPPREASVSLVLSRDPDPGQSKPLIQLKLTYR